MPQLDLDDGSVETTEKDAESNKGMVPMAIETDANTENLAGKGESKCLGKYEYGTKPWHIFMYAPEIYKADKAQLLNEVAAGLTVAFAQVSESVAFCFHRRRTIAWVACCLDHWIISFFLRFKTRNDKRSHRRTRSCDCSLRREARNSILVLHRANDFGFQVLAGMLKLAKFVRLVPRSVMVGFVNGLAIILALGQLFTFKDRPNPNKPLPANTTMPKMADIPYISDGTTLGFMFMHIALVALIIFSSPRSQNTGKISPASLVGLMFVTFIEWVFLRPNGVSTPVIGEVSTVRWFHHSFLTRSIRVTCHR